MDSVIKHNLDKAPKTGEWRYMSPEVDAEKCLGCGTCVLFCPEAAIKLRPNVHPEKNKNSKGVASIDYDWCKGCGVCAVECPKKAIKMVKLK
ncbi:MAG: 4Fe-4S binding protein [bacterium]|nr:4Fe-4S binding protein [bacterium]